MAPSHFHIILNPSELYPFHSEQDTLLCSYSHSAVSCQSFDKAQKVPLKKIKICLKTNVNSFS